MKARVRKRFTCTTMSNHDQPVAAMCSIARSPPRRRTAAGSVTRPNSSSARAASCIWRRSCDLYSRFIVGWAVSAVNDRHLTLKALGMALKRRCPTAGLIHHSDQGCTYASEDYQRLLDAHGITCSMSRRGNCYDNAVMEAFFSSLKSELADRFASCGTPRWSCSTTSKCLITSAVVTPRLAT